MTIFINMLMLMMLLMLISIPNIESFATLRRLVGDWVAAAQKASTQVNALIKALMLLLNLMLVVMVMKEGEWDSTERLVIGWQLC